MSGLSAPLKLLVLCSNDEREASLRHRVLAFLPRLAAAGHSATVSSFFDSEGSWGARVLQGIVRRAGDVVRARDADRVLIHREALPLAHNEYVRLLPTRAELIFDFDDAVFLEAHAGWRARVARPASTRLVIERSARVFAGSEFLADYAQRFNSNVELMPTVVDTDRFVPRVAKSWGLPVVGWVGSPTTARYLDQILPALEQVAREVPFRLRLVGAGRRFNVQGVEIEHREWQLRDEVTAFQDLDLGLYPLEDDDWARGKCGFKAIQYMACGVPFVVSPVGAINTIVEHGVHGLWARNSADWVGGVLALLRDQDLGRRLAQASRQRVVEHYSVAALAPRWIEGIVAPRAKRW